MLRVADARPVASQHPPRLADGSDRRGARAVVWSLWRAAYQRRARARPWRQVGYNTISLLMRRAGLARRTGSRTATRIRRLATAVDLVDWQAQLHMPSTASVVNRGLMSRKRPLVIPQRITASTIER